MHDRRSHSPPISYLDVRPRHKKSISNGTDKIATVYKQYCYTSQASRCAATAFIAHVCFTLIVRTNFLNHCMPGQSLSLWKARGYCQDPKDHSQRLGSRSPCWLRSMWAELQPGFQVSRVGHRCGGPDVQEATDGGHALFYGNTAAQNADDGHF
jgi:hypothetical protein